MSPEPQSSNDAPFSRAGTSTPSSPPQHQHHNNRDGSHYRNHQRRAEPLYRKDNEGCYYVANTSNADLHITIEKPRWVSDGFDTNLGTYKWRLYYDTDTYVVHQTQQSQMLTSGPQLPHLIATTTPLPPLVDCAEMHRSPPLTPRNPPALPTFDVPTLLTPKTEDQSHKRKAAEDSSAADAKSASATSAQPKRARYAGPEYDGPTRSITDSTLRPIKQEEEHKDAEKLFESDHVSTTTPALLECNFHDGHVYRWTENKSSTFSLPYSAELENLLRSFSARSSLIEEDCEEEEDQDKQARPFEMMSRFTNPTCTTKGARDSSSKTSSSPPSSPPMSPQFSPPCSP